MTPQPPGPLEQGEVLQDLAGRLVAVVPEGWQQLTYLARVIGAYRADMLAVQEADGQVRQLEVPGGVGDLVDTLKRSGFQEGAGTWLSMVLSVHHSHRFNVEYNHDTEPDLPPGTSPLVYAQELERFPRAHDRIPDWLGARLEQARELEPERTREEFGAALVRACEREGLRADFLPPTRLRVFDFGGAVLMEADMGDTFDQAVIAGEEQRTDLAARFADFMAGAAREREQGTDGSSAESSSTGTRNADPAGAPSAPDPDDTVAVSLAAAFAEAGVGAAFQGADTLVVTLPDGNHASADISGLRAALSEATPEQIAHNTAQFARTSVEQLSQATGQGGGDTDGRLRARLYPASAFPEGVLESLLAREVAPGLWQTVVVDAADSLRPLPRQVHERSGRPDGEVFAEAVAASVAETVEVSEHEVDGAHIVHIGGQHPYVAAHAHALDRYLGDLPHGALVAFPVPEVLLAHPLGQGHPIAALDHMQQIAERFTADGDKPVSAQLYWWHPGSRSREQGTPPDLRPVGARIDHENRSVELLTSDEEFGPMLDSLVG
ncbi:hypothetical protein MRI28_07555 [Nocardiopsis dassonvillei]|uniref:hypothetical protein n=1 Tax=Nocardiopsis dassonvillei TaxID=2014 RepID=UPI00200D8259|nr:hypothetical protein [Nocardiopsis dassonvillei]MCK9869509.1 hypothetical protein [Nocardiopsis dassonvillei]